MRAYGLLIEADLANRWSVVCRSCGTEVLLSHLADITSISAVLQPPVADFSVIETTSEVWQRLTIRRKDTTTITIHDCKGQP